MLSNSHPCHCSFSDSTETFGCSSTLSPTTAQWLIFFEGWNESEDLNIITNFCALCNIYTYTYIYEIRWYDIPFYKERMSPPKSSNEQSIAISFSGTSGTRHSLGILSGSTIGSPKVGWPPAVSSHGAARHQWGLRRGFGRQTPRVYVQ